MNYLDDKDYFTNPELGRKMRKVLLVAIFTYLGSLILIVVNFRETDHHAKKAFISLNEDE